MERKRGAVGLQLAEAREEGNRIIEEARKTADQLRRDIGLALDTADVRSRAESAGFEITPSTPQALSERIEADIALYTPLIRQGRIARALRAIVRASGARSHNRVVLEIME